MDSSLSPLHGFDDNRLYPPLNTQDVSFKNINVGILPFTRKKKTKKSVLAISSRVRTAPHRISSLYSFFKLILLTKTYNKEYIYFHDD